jgi:mannosyltransferase
VTTGSTLKNLSMIEPSGGTARLEPRTTGLHPAVLVVSFLTLGALILRVIGLNSALWYDEIFSLVVTSRPPLREILTHYHGEIQHPLYSALAHVAVSLLGESAWTARLPAVAFGVATIPLLFFLARAIASEREGLLAAAFIALSYHHVWFSQNARGYTALLFWTMLSTLLFYRGLQGRRWPVWLGYAIAAALGAYTHPTFALVVLGQGAVVLIVAAHSKWRGHDNPIRIGPPCAAIVLSGVLALALYAPFIGQFAQHYRGHAGQMRAVSTPLWAAVEAWRGLELGLGSQLVLAAGAVLVGCGLLGYWRENRIAFLLLVVPSAVTVLGVVGISRSMYPRYLFFALGFGILIVVRGAMVLGSALGRLAASSRDAGLGRAIGTAFMLLLIGASAASLGRVYRLPKQDFAGALEFLESRRRPPEPVLTAGAAAWPYQNYYGRAWPKIKDSKQIDAMGGRDRRVWLVYAFPSYIDDETPGLMDEIRRQFRTVRVFPGTLSQGEVYVCVKDVTEAASL